MSEKYKQFEAEIGDLESIYHCQKRIESRMNQERIRIEAQQKRNRKKTRAKDKYDQMNKAIEQNMYAQQQFPQIQQQQQQQSFGITSAPQQSHQTQQNNIVGTKRKFEESLDDVTTTSGNTSTNPEKKRKTVSGQTDKEKQKQQNDLSQQPRDSAASAVTDTVVMTGSPTNSGTIENDNKNKNKNKNQNNDDNDNDNHDNNLNDKSTKNIEEIGTKSERSIFIMNFRKTCKEEDLLALVSKYGTILKLHMPKEKNKKYRTGYGFAIYSHKNEALNAIKELNETYFQGKKLQVQRYQTKQNETNTVHIKGLKHLSKSEAQEYIKTFFDGCGEIVEMRLPVEKKRNENDKDVIKGFAYVQFDNASSVNNALTLDKSKFGGRIIEVQQYNDLKRQEKENANRNKRHGKGRGRRHSNDTEMDDDARFGITNSAPKEQQDNSNANVKPEERGNDYFSNLYG